MIIRRAIVTLFAVVLSSGAVWAQDSSSNSPSCTRCTYPQGWSLETELGAGYVSDSSFKFGDYTGLNDQGGFFFGDIFADYWGASEKHWRFRGRNLGLDSRSIAIEGGRQGHYALRFGYDKLPHTRFESGATPFVNPATSSLSLPTNWVAGASTRDMPALAQSLRSVDIRTDRETFSVGFSLMQNARLEYNVDYQYATKEGTGMFGGSFLNTSTILPRPVDYENQTLEAAVSYRGDDWSIRLGYLGSLFSNDTPTLRWDNPFIPVVTGANTGQAALEPDNDFHQLALSGQTQVMSHMQLSGSIAVGRMTQDDDLLPFTINPDLTTPLPAPILNSEVDTLHVDFRIASRPTRKLRLRGSYTRDERDNGTPILEWAYVIGEALSAASRLNLPYGYERDKISLRADYRLPYRIKASGGWKRDVYQRDFTEVGRSDEDKLWGKLKFRAGDRADLSVEYAYAERDISDYRPVAATLPPQNPLLRKYNLADRERQGLEWNLALRPTDAVDLSLVAEFMQDDYDDRALGLIDADYESVYADAAFMLPGNGSLSAHAGYEQYSSVQRGSQSFSQPDWRTNNEDETVFTGLHIDLPQWIDRFDAQLGYTFSETTGTMRSTTAGALDTFPDFNTRLHRVELNVDYQWRDNLSLRLSWTFEDYTVDDWTLDTVDPDTLPRVLSLGNRWLGYDVNVVVLSLKYNLAEPRGHIR